ncbi:hypothetical protein NLJ89_g2717 [Agrocybe chaxingu]|uniref:Uncharacterized protein n=1 Tax=Agrocybe chaxingu TaxID=84603 RepID=A0A9W8MYS2_9AGAR|nr:hypothetical protein NLJ89_g2717 [Agrocybe chaxingu]
MSSMPRVVIVGAGASGLACAISLKKVHGHDNFTIYEKGSDVGGTWRDNIYPGCSSDVPMSFYSLSSDLHDWPQSHGSNEDIQAYWVGLTRKYGLYRHIEFNKTVVLAEWNSEKQLYTLTVENLATGEQSVTTAAIVVSAIGVLGFPRYAGIPGRETFKGELFHSGRWDTSIDLAGKKVGVIGNGASATQFIPCITEDPNVNVVNFCRTPNWLLPPARKTYSNLRRAILRNIPFAYRLVRWAVFLRFEFMYLAVFGNAFLRKIVTKLLTSYIRYTAPPGLHDKLIPSFPVGCKRVIFDTHYLKALHRPNLKVNWDGVERITEDGIITKTGDRIPLDVLIFATGYAADEYPLPVVGNRKMSIQESFRADGGGKAYLGTTVPGFPNFFMITGPNVVTGHTSVIYTTEVQINYIMQLIAPILGREIESLEVTQNATDAYDDKIQARLSNSVFMHCHSWYRVGGQGKVTNNFPAAATVFWLWLRKPNWNHYKVVGGESNLSMKYVAK